MNGAGKRGCIADASLVLRMLSGLLGHQKQNLVPYINGALYSVFGVPAIRVEALTLVRLTSFFSSLSSHILHFSSVLALLLVADTAGLRGDVQTADACRHA